MEVGVYRVHGWRNEDDLLLHVDAAVGVPRAYNRSEKVVGHAVDHLQESNLSVSEACVDGHVCRMIECEPWLEYLR